MATIITGRDREVRFGPGLPTVIIGERINPTGRKKMATLLATGNLDVVEQEAISQKEAGADVLDVNVGAAEVDEVFLLPKAVQRSMETTGLPICIDSADVAAMEAALKAYPYKALINSVTGEERSLSRVLPLVSRFKAAVIGLTIDDNGIPQTAERRVEIACKIADRAASYGIPREDLVIDCLTLAASANPMSTPVTLQALRTITRELSLATAMGVSNISFGMPERKIINNAFLAMAIEAGLSAAIVDPTNEGLIYTILSSNFLSGKDDYARRFLTYYRAKPRN
jgi:5-methyltetrahydrofolate--homocysteine methyltransferase